LDPSELFFESDSCEDRRAEMLRWFHFLRDAAPPKALASMCAKEEASLAQT